MSAIFFRQAIVGEDFGDESCADVKTQPCEQICDLVHIEVGFVALLDDERFDLTCSFLCCLRSRPLRQQVCRRSIENSIADIIVGLARLEAKGLGQLALGKVRQLSQSGSC